MRLWEMIYTEEELQQEIRAKECWRDLYREQLEKNKKLKENNDKLKELVKIPCTSYTRDLEQENRRLSEKNKIYSNALVQEKEENKKLKEELGKITIHSNMLESENKLFKEELKARLERIKELEK